MSEPISDAPSAGTGGDTTGTTGGGKDNSTLILVLGIVGLLCCNLLGPVVWYMGKQELRGIAEGRIVATNEGTARAGMILGIIGTAFLAFGILWIFFFGGMAILGAAFEQ
ncbi:MAG: DUF4190 domain-containing protein [Thermoanaerobaculia bacterium]